MSIFIENNTKIKNSIIGTNKYHNKKCKYNDITFDSKKERNFYIMFEKMQKNGQISDLKRQVEFELQPGFVFQGKKIRPIKYIADFTYIYKGKLHIVDTKGVRTDVYNLKKKMMMYKGYEIEEL
ncbi:MAG: DUF1064 domain-containing protein [Clostridia bacterium]|nr:DUF1064 domain-containing protein [Clostridia bacterium]MBR6517109.1 DUF1064 domain-containing protein [Bacilli bacterium]